MNVLKTLIVAIFGLSLYACSIGSARHWDVQDGLVLDATTQNPIEGAIVVARWQGWISALVDSRSVCYHVETARSGADGRFRIEKWTKLPGKVHHEGIELSVYKAGYRYVSSKDEFYYLEQDTRSADQRLDYLFNVAVKCDLNAENQKKLLVLYTAIYDEAQRIAETKQEKIKALHHLKRIEWITLGSTEAWTRFYARSRELR